MGGMGKRTRLPVVFGRRHGQEYLPMPPRHHLQPQSTFFATFAFAGRGPLPSLESPAVCRVDACLVVGVDVATVEDQFTAIHAGEGLLELGPTHADGFHFRTDQDNSALELGLDEEFMERAAIVDPRLKGTTFFPGGHCTDDMVKLEDLKLEAARLKFARFAGVAKLADAQDSGSCVRKDVEVRLLSSALTAKGRLARVFLWIEVSKVSEPGD